MKHVLVE